MAWNWVSLESYQQRLASVLTISAIGGSDYHQSCDLQPEGPFVLARPTTVLWLESLSESAILDAMKTGRGYITESPTGPHLELTCDGLPMGTKFDTGTHEIKVAARGAAGDELVLFDATGEIARVPIQADDWTYTSDLAPHLFLRCEIIARASRERLITQLHTALAGLPLPFGLTENIIDSQPIRRALSNPVYFSQPELSC